MSKRNGKNAENTPTNSATATPGQIIDIWKLIPIAVSIISLVVSIINSIMTFSLTMVSERRAIQNQTLAYSITAENLGMKYTYTYNGEEIVIPAPSIELKITTGAICSVTPIRFDDNGIKIDETVTFEVENTLVDKEYYLTIDTESPGEVIFEGVIAYDYSFLYIQPLSGEPILDMVCHRINLSTGMVQSRVYHRIDLLGTDYQDSSVFSEIMKKYEQLYDLIDEFST